MAVALSGARPVYLEPEQVRPYGISTAISIKTLIAGVAALIDANRFPRAILIDELHV